MQEKRIYQIIKKNKKEISNYKEFLELLLINSFLKEPNLLNPIVVKLSLNDELYNYYLAGLLKCSREEYFTKVFQLFQDEKIAINYISKNIDIMDHENEIDKTAALIYFSKLKEKVDLSKKEVRFFTKYIIGKRAYENNVNVKVLSVNIAEYNKFNKKKKKKYVLETETENHDWYGRIAPNGERNFIIYINQESYENDKIIKGNNEAFLNLISTCYHELQHSIKNSNFTRNLNRRDYRIWKENLINIFDHKCYNTNYLVLESELDANIAAENMLLEDIENGSLEKYSKCINNINKVMKNKKFYRCTEEYYAVEDIIDKVVLENYKQIPTFKQFNIEYNSFGKRNDIYSILFLKERDFDPFEKKVNNLKYTYITEKLSMEQRKSIKNSIETSEPILHNLKDIYNQLIYKAMIRRPNDTFITYLTDGEIKSLNDALNAEIAIIESDIAVNNEIFVSEDRNTKNKVFLEKKKQEIIDMLNLIEQKKKGR